MLEHQFSYLLKAIPGSLATSYLKDAFGFETQRADNGLVFLFLSYRSPPFPDSYQTATRQFPLSCFVLNSRLSDCFVLLADQVEIYNILSWAKDQSCPLLAKALERKLQPQSPCRFRIRNEVWDGRTPKIMAILNITPDSFYDGGTHYGLKDYGDVAARLIEEGADIIDIGGESTRPGSQSVSAAEEIKRILPAIHQIRSRFEIPLSVDTVKPVVAREVLENGVDMINDTSGLSAGQELVAILKKFNASYCLMHTQGAPALMQKNPTYQDVLAELFEFFLSKLETCYNQGLARERICIDPGIGFGKTVHHNLNLLRFLSVFTNLNHSVLLGTSNKSFIGHVLNREKEGRLVGSLTTQVMGWLNGAGIFRVHNIQSTKDALTMANLYTDGQRSV